MASRMSQHQMCLAASRRALQSVVVSGIKKKEQERQQALRDEDAEKVAKLDKLIDNWTARLSEMGR